MGEIVTIDGAERMLLDGYPYLLISATGSIMTHSFSWGGPTWTDEHYSEKLDELSEWYRFLDDNVKEQFHELSKEEAEEEDAEAEEEDAEALENATAELTEKSDTKAGAEAAAGFEA